jgi:ABC-type glutathione transport system ATPase component
MKSNSTEMMNPMTAGAVGVKAVNIDVKKSEPVKIEWKDLSYTIEIKSKETSEFKTILHPLTGAAKPGEVLAIMGTSGAGKVNLIFIVIMIYIIYTSCLHWCRVPC